MKNHILIFAHPDDEIIFSSSLINSAKKIIICFSEIEDNKLVSKGRKKLLKDELFSKMHS